MPVKDCIKACQYKGEHLRVEGFGCTWIFGVCRVQSLRV